MTEETDFLEADLARELLIEMLASIRHSRSTPLFFGIDAVRIVTAAERKVDVSGEDAGRIRSAIERIASDALGCLDFLDRGAPEEPATAERLADWLEERHLLLGSVHPLAIDILGLLVEGESIRDLAERLDLGLRLAKRICDDARAAWLEGRAQCSSP